MSRAINTEKRARVLELYNEGLSLSAIARKLNCTLGSIRDMAKRMGLETDVILRGISYPHGRAPNAADRAYVEEHYLKGETYQEIATALKTTRAAIGGLITRMSLKGCAPKRVKHAWKRGLGMSDRESKTNVSVARIVQARAERASSPQVLAAPVLETVEPPEASKPVTIMDLDDSICHWPLFDDPLGDPAEKFYCGAPTTEAKSYCLSHMALSIGHWT